MDSSLWLFLHTGIHAVFSERENVDERNALNKKKTIAVGFHLQQLAPGGSSLQNPLSQIALKKMHTAFKVQEKKEISEQV